MERKKNNQLHHHHHPNTKHRGKKEGPLKVSLSIDLNKTQKEEERKKYHIRNNRVQSYFLLLAFILLLLQQHQQQQKKSSITSYKKKNFNSIAEAAGFFNTNIKHINKNNSFLYSHRYPSSSTDIPSSRLSTRLGFILPVVSAAEIEQKQQYSQKKQKMNNSNPKSSDISSSLEDTTSAVVPSDQVGDNQEGEETQSNNVQDENDSSSSEDVSVDLPSDEKADDKQEGELTNIKIDDDSDGLSYDNEEEKEDYITTSSSRSSSLSPEEKKYRIQTHYIFLVHGYLGNDSEMSSIQESIAKALERQNQSNGGVLNNNDRIVAHSVQSNNDRTTDGIANGGTRVAQEIKDFIQQDMIKNIIDKSKQKDEQEQQHEHVSISFIGNSLGGLYSRYALPIIPTEFESHEAFSESERSASTCTSSFRIHLHPNIFCTTVTPHLGVASNTYFNIPRFMEHIVGTAMRHTGRELFRLDREQNDKNENKNHDDDDDRINKPTDLIYKMAVEDRFIQPLLAFRKRIAYINSFGSDFQVPTATAAFLDEESDYPHFVLDITEVSTSSSFITAMVQTETNYDVISTTNKEWYENKSSHLIMSNKLDALGWTKVFIDTRDKIPLPSFNKVNVFSFGKKKKTYKEVWDDFVESKRFDGENKNEKVGSNSDDSANGYEGEIIATIESKDMHELLTKNDKLMFPAGHTVLVANSKSKSYKNFNAQGRPVMDKLARDVVAELLSNAKD